MTTRSAFSASRRIALRTFGASRRTASPPPSRCCLTNAARARSAWARTARVIPGGTRWRTTTVAPWWRAIALAKWIASSAWGPPRTGTRTRRIGPRTSLLDHRDVARRVANDLVDRGREDRRRGALTARRRLAAPAEDDEVRLLFGAGLDDPFGRVPADPDDRADRRTVGDVVEDALEQSSSVPGPGGTFRERHALRNLDDSEGGQLARTRIEHRGAEADQLLRGHRVGDRDEDPDRERDPGRHGVASFQRSTRYGLSSSNSRACRSTRSSACSVVTLRFSTMKLPTRPK